MHLLGCSFEEGRAKGAPLMRRERIDKETLGQAMSRDERYPQGQAFDAKKEFGVEDDELQAFVETIADAPDTPIGLLPHQVPNQDAIYPELQCKLSEAEEFLDFENDKEDDGFLDRIGTKIAHEIARDAREQGRRSGNSSRQ